MNGEKKVILHLIFDGVLFDRVYPRFEEMKYYENRYLLGIVCGNNQFKHINNIEKIIQCDTIESWGRIISDQDVDIVYLHGLWIDYLKAIDYIRDDVVVMWWCYGMEIYESIFGWPPLLPMKIFKPRTHWLYLKYMGRKNIIQTEIMYFSPKLYVFLKKVFNYLTGRNDEKLYRMLSRIDFAWTPLDVELYEIKKRCSYIKAKPYSLWGKVEKTPLIFHNGPGGVLLEHSANISNNHLDIIAYIKKSKLNLRGRDIFIPLGYGQKYLAEIIEKKAVFDGAVTHCMMESIPYQEYDRMMSNCTHAIFGMIRQSGLGNINLCFKKGIKVFFFKDSMLYKQFKADGYYVYSIENDLNDNSIKEPLTSEQARFNYNKFYSRFDNCEENYEEQFDNILK